MSWSLVTAPATEPLTTADIGYALIRAHLPSFKGSAAKDVLESGQTKVEL